MTDDVAALDPAEIKRLIEAIVVACGKAGDEAPNEEAVEAALEPLLAAQASQPDVAFALIDLLNRSCLAIEEAGYVLESLFAAHDGNPLLVAAIGDALVAARDINDLNAPPPEEPLFAAVLEKLLAFCEDCDDEAQEASLLKGVFTVARLLARQHDRTALQAAQRLTELQPNRSYTFYNLGLLHKTRGRFQESLAANRRAAQLEDPLSEACAWNLGIAATGAQAGEIALGVWESLEQKVRMGRFDLPEGGYPACKVRLAEFPLAERDVDNDAPGREETIWVERLSPCHGIVRSVLYQPLGVDYGDVILFDGAPMTYHRYGDTETPVFPHLATLRRQGYRFFDFAATQTQSGQVSATSDALPQDAVVYCHTEQYRTLCAECWRDISIDHAAHRPEEKLVVTGRIAAPPEIAPPALLAALDAAMADSAATIYAPELLQAAGESNRLASAKRRYDLIVGKGTVTGKGTETGEET